MPYCEPCDQYHTPSALESDGACPNCGTGLASPADADNTERAPWHFKLLVGGVVVYLGWRTVQMLGWLVN